MPSIPRRLKQLDRMLAGLPDDVDPMLISELDGYLAGIIVCPDLVMPGEWLPTVWGSGDKESTPALADIALVQKFTELVMEHYNAIINGLSKGRYMPVFDVDDRNDDILWELWIDGFGMAMALRPEAWTTIAGGDKDARAALAGMVTLGAIGRGESDLPTAEIDQLTDLAPDLIQHWVEVLDAARVSQSGLRKTSHQTGTGKIGRNAPCPCGSGKKYKRCCGLN